MASFIGGIVNISIGAIVLQAVYLSTIHSANQTGWSSSEVSLWSVLGLAGVIGLLVGVLQLFGIM
jgi:uncharacterized membrane protein YsdA (DUF1294 family)